MVSEVSCIKPMAANEFEILISLNLDFIQIRLQMKSAKLKLLEVFSENF